MSNMRSKIKLLAVGMAIALTACTVENNRSIAILFNGALEDDCTLDTEPEQFISSGTLDVALGDEGLQFGYFMGLVVENRMPETVTTRTATTGAEVERTTERNQMQIRGFEVDLAADCEGQDGCGEVAAIVNDSFRIPGAANLDPTSRQAIGADVIPLHKLSDLKRVIRPNHPVNVRASIRAFGGRTPDEEIESGDFEYYITMCNECLVEGLDRQCPGGPFLGYCGFPQEARLSCCLLGGELLCPAALATPTP